MLTKKRHRRPRRTKKRKQKQGKLLNRIVENNLIHRVDYGCIQRYTGFCASSDRLLGNFV